VTITRVEKITMDFVGTEGYVMAKAEVRDLLQLLSCIDPTDGIVRIAEEEDFGSVHQECFERGEVNLIALALLNQRRILENPAISDRVSYKMEIYGRLNENGIARV
jgi:hypothetical protein